MSKTDQLPNVNGPGVSRPVIKDVDAAIRKYEKKKDARCKETPGERDAKNELQDLLHKNREALTRNSDGNLFYRYEVSDGVFKDYILTEKLTIKKADEDEAAE